MKDKFNRLTKKELIQILLDHNISPPNAVSSHGPHGRPCAEEFSAKLELIRNTLYELFPQEITTHKLAKIVGSDVRTLQRLKSDIPFLESLSPKLAAYFTSLPKTNWHGNVIIPVYRALLDVHYYLLSLQIPQQPLPVYQAHVMIYKKPDIVKSSVLSVKEHKRIFRKTFLARLEDAGLQAPEKVSWSKPFAKIPCQDGCDVGRLILFEDGINVGRALSALLGKEIIDGESLPDKYWAAVELLLFRMKSYV